MTLPQFHPFSSLMCSGGAWFRLYGRPVDHQYLPRASADTLCQLPIRKRRPLLWFAAIQDVERVQDPADLAQPKLLRISIAADSAAGLIEFIDEKGGGPGPNYWSKFFRTLGSFEMRNDRRFECGVSTPG